MIMKKGQFFMAAAIFLILVFYMGMAPYIETFYSGPSMEEEMSSLYENIQREFPRAFNLALDTDSPAEALSNFTLFAKNATMRRGADYRCLWLFTENRSGDLNVTVGNFFGSGLEVILNVSGDVETLTVGSDRFSSHLFSSPPSEFELSLSFNNTESNLLLEKYKANLYLVMEMSRGSDKIAGDITA